MKISAAIITYNEERNIPRSLELPPKPGARVIDSNWRGYAGQKNYASSQCEHDWVLSLDADEALSEALEGEIWQIKKNGPEFDAYTMPRLAQYLGRKVRLFDRRQAQWVGGFVHESVVTQGNVGHLKSNILHFTCSSLSEHLKTMDRYTTLAAEQLVEQKTPVGWTQLAVNPAWTFFKTYILRRGFMDGMEGLAIAHMAALYNFLKYAKAKNMSPRR